MRPEYSFEEIDRWVLLEREDSLHLAVAVVVLTVCEGTLQVLMVENDKGPYEGHFVLPHRILPSDKMIDAVAAEVFSDAAEQSSAAIEQFWTYSTPERDPRGRVLTTGYVGAAPFHQMNWVSQKNDSVLLDIELEAGTAVLSLGGLGMRAGFSHDELVYGAISHLRESLDYSLAAFRFLPEAFTLRELREVHEALLGKPIKSPWFTQKMRQRVFAGDLQLVGIGQTREGEVGKPAELYELRHVPEAERLARARSRRARARMEKWLGGREE